MAKRGDPRLSRDYKKFRLKVLARDQWSCFYCQQPATTVDHIIPVSKAPAPTVKISILPPTVKVKVPEDVNTWYLYEPIVVVSLPPEADGGGGPLGLSNPVIVLSIRRLHPRRTRYLFQS